MENPFQAIVYRPMQSPYCFHASIHLSVIFSSHVCDLVGKESMAMAVLLNG